MIIVFKKRLIALILCCVLVFFAALAAASVSVSARPADNKISIVLDPGHGGKDTGAKGIVTGVEESDLNLMVSRLLKEYLEAAGFNVTMTRSTGDGLYGAATLGFKKRDMQRRKEIIEESAPDLVISIHMNKYSASYRRGAQVFWENDADKALAEAIQRVLNSNLNMREVGRALTDLYGDYFILNVSSCPAVIVECGFLSNAEDEALLIREAYRKEMAYNIFTGIMVYLTASGISEETAAA